MIRIVQVMKMSWLCSQDRWQWSWSWRGVGFWHQGRTTQLGRNFYQGTMYCTKVRRESGERRGDKVGVSMGFQFCNFKAIWNPREKRRNSVGCHFESGLCTTWHHCSELSQCVHEFGDRGQMSALSPGEFNHLHFTRDRPDLKAHLFPIKLCNIRVQKV